ncbi:heterokaryon incompatibility protein-domain-containing protein, partial [Leptodontidium sp. MPI-SDFR-AT-0119]
MNAFTYNLLEVTKPQIRLVHLLPLNTIGGQQSGQRQQLSCTIQSVFLDKNPIYIALSYNCGQQVPNSKIFVKGDNDDPSSETAISITPSLETALLKIRDNSKIITIWIDQVCINQSDIGERNSQVLLMKTIYEKAKEVLVWLGPAYAESDHLLKILDKVGKQASQAGLFDDDKSKSEKAYAFEVSLSELRKSDRLSPRFTIPTESLRSFVLRPWWTRVWVVQEISVASSVTFVCGDQRIKYDDLHNALQFYAFYIMRKAENFQARHGLVKLFMIRTLLALQNAPYDSPATQMLWLSYKYKLEKKFTGGRSLLRTLEILHVVKDTSSKVRLQATDDRDMIYGLLGLVEDAKELGIKPRYEKETTLTYVLIEVARALLESGQVDLLWFCQLSKSKIGHMLPSWAPDWTGDIQTPYGSDFSSSSRPFAASGDANARVGRVGSNERCITLQGILVDEVVEVGKVWEETSGSNSHQSDLKLNLFFDEALRNGTALDPSVIEEARWRTPIGDKEWEDEVASTRRSTTQSRDIYLEVCRRIEIQKSLPIPSKKRTQKAGLSYMKFMRQMYGRRPLRTRNGYAGLGPIYTTKEDIVCIIFGAQVPYVLRPDGKGQYRLVGEAYIHGIMDGEFMEKKTVTVEFPLC